ncbi:hypothetical protein EI555_020241, partial [Monodon monoceros]
LQEINVIFRKANQIELVIEHSRIIRHLYQFTQVAGKGKPTAVGIEEENEKDKLFTKMWLKGKKETPDPPKAEAKAKVLKAKKAALKGTQDTAALKAAQISLEDRPHYAIIKFPLTTKSHQIQQAVGKLYDMEVAKVNTLIKPDGEKKAYVPLDSYSSFRVIMTLMALRIVKMELTIFKFEKVTKKKSITYYQSVANSYYQLYEYKVDTTSYEGVLISTKG